MTVEMQKQIDGVCRDFTKYQLRNEGHIEIRSQAVPGLRDDEMLRAMAHCIRYGYGKLEDGKLVRTK